VIVVNSDSMLCGLKIWTCDNAASIALFMSSDVGKWFSDSELVFAMASLLDTMCCMIWTRRGIENRLSLSMTMIAPS